MANVTGIKEVQRALTKLSKAHIGENIVVGFTQNYAIYVHENRGSRHTTGKAGFLLDNAIELRGEMASTIAEVTRKTGSVEKGLAVAGTRLQAAAQEDTPVDLGALKASAFTARESDLEAAVKAAFEKGNKKRNDEVAKRRTRAADKRTKARKKKRRKR